MIYIRSSRCVNEFAATNKIGVPGNDVFLRMARFERAITLPKRSTIPPPSREESVFHVKHAPVHEVPPILWTLLQQAMHVGIDELQRQGVNELYAVRS